MKAKSLALLAGSAAALMLADQAPAGFLGITTQSKENEFGILTVSVYGEFDNPGEDFMLAIAGTNDSPLSIQVVGGTFYNHQYGETHPYAPDANLVAMFPSLAFDTFVTIGVKSVGQGGQPADDLTVTPGFPPLTGGHISTTTAAWAVTPVSPQGDPFDPVCFPGNGRILIGQFSTETGSAIQGTMLILVRSDGVVELVYVSFGGGVTFQWIVDDDNCPGPGSGTPDDPFCSIQTAIGASVFASEIIVEPGTYYESIDFLDKTINLRSSGGPEVTIIDATGLGSVSVVTCNSGEGPGTVLDGFTITGGTALNGGGMFNDGTSPTVTDCIFIGNLADEFGGGMYNTNGSSPAVTDCVFSGNAADSFGGGMANITSNPKVTNCTFIGNFGVTGGGMGNFDNSLSVINCTFIGNTGVTGGGMGNFNGSPTVINCTFSGNTVSDSAGGMYNVNSNPAVANCVMWGDSPDELGSGDAAVSYSTVQGGWPGVGNFDSNPWFLDPDNGDYRLGPGSPCIDAGDNTAVPLYIVDDLDTNPRFVDAVDYVDTGNGVAPIVDMGPYEADEFTPPVLLSNSDILWRHFSGQTFVWLMDGTQRIDQGPPGSAGPDWQIVDAGDFDGDGHADVLWHNTSTGQVFIWFLDGTERVGQGAVGVVSLVWEIAGIGNFDGDPEGRSDILWRNTSSGQVFIWLLDGTQRIAEGTPGTAGTQWQIAGVGDFDGDSRSDILWRNISSGQVFIWFIDGTGRIDAGSAGSIPQEWQIAGTGNFDGDLVGRSDILWRHDNGQVFIWLMNGTQQIGQGSPGSVGTQWQIVETGDLDGDGRSDILWRNQAASGQVFAWFIDGTDRVGQGPLGAISHDWKIVGTVDFDGE